ncbi:glycosyltransferase family 2 protein [Algoriphagus sp. C2-6-M1]|uniref:glycosyltransferase family 2 protein n=1 Tax=Algoriphagus persicinus TaxID=3108754 RepID=UPI002B3A92D0|nr:glycosyltransferase family 2 protein [Algoriphagus sp. C2-6-M1]MEB2782429.1 glycosyltransferase family 2 protein [Algoriphagus sp. C2-6-M1]
MESSLVSILIPNYNKAPYLAETLNSVLAQTYTNWECIIVDDRSTDGSFAIMEKYGAKDARFKIFKRPAHLPKGGNVCRNYALEVSKGEYIQWFDSDDLMMSSLVLERLAFIHSNPNKDFVVSSGIKFFDYVGDSEIVFSHVFYKNTEIESFISLDPAWLTQSCMFKRSFLIDNNILWEESLTILQDVHYDLKSALAANSIGHLNEKFDWCWRWHKSGRNTGAQRANIENLPTFKSLVKYFSSLCQSNPTRGFYLNKGCYELIKSTHSIFGFKWFKDFYFDSINVLSLSFFKKCFLISNVYLLLIVCNFIPSINTFVVKSIISLNRRVLLGNFKHVKIFNTKSLSDFKLIISD